MLCLFKLCVEYGLNIGICFSGNCGFQRVNGSLCLLNSCEELGLLCVFIFVVRCFILGSAAVDFLLSRNNL